MTINATCTRSVEEIIDASLVRVLHTCDGDTVVSTGQFVKEYSPLRFEYVRASVAVMTAKFSLDRTTPHARDAQRNFLMYLSYVFSTHVTMIVYT